MVMTAPQLASALSRYAERLHATAAEEHHVLSPLGAWLLLALAGTAADTPARPALVDALGVDVTAASDTAAELLRRPHPLVVEAVAVWYRAMVETPALSRWLRSLPSTVETGGLPTQADADAWASRNTDGLIERFPLQLTGDVLFVLASALATRVSWEAPFDVVPAGALGADSPWSAEVTTVLHTPHDPRHRQFIASTERAGDVAVHTAEARDGLAVTSVVAASGVARADVLAAAYDIAIATATRADVRQRSLFDLPLGSTDIWSIREEPVRTSAWDGREERCVAVLPAWSARSDHDLALPRLGFDAAAATMAAAMELRSYYFEARQSAMARYTRIGFEAAAVTGLAIATSMQAARDGVARTADLRFAHPYAVVAVTVDENWDTGELALGPWHGVPVFSAWVAHPDDAGDD